MEEAFARTIRPKLDVIDKVRPYLADQNIDLPAIVVVGDQSSGKSSLLESISGGPTKSRPALAPTVWESLQPRP